MPEKPDKSGHFGTFERGGNRDFVPYWPVGVRFCPRKVLFCPVFVPFCRGLIPTWKAMEAQENIRRIGADRPGQVPARIVITSILAEESGGWKGAAVSALGIRMSASLVRLPVDGQPETWRERTTGVWVPAGSGMTGEKGLLWLPFLKGRVNRGLGSCLRRNDGSGANEAI